MKSHIATAAITALIVGATSAGGATMLANHRSSATGPRASARRAHRAKPVARVTTRRDPCAKLAHSIVGRSIGDRHLRRLMRRNDRCRSVVVNSKSPRKTVTISRAAPPGVITVPGPVAAVPGPSSGPSSGSYDDERGTSGSQHDD
jgi:hypothetical protein